MISALATLCAFRRSDAALRFLAFVNTLFFLSFLAVLVAASNTAQAEEVVCTGSNLVTQMRENDPSAYKTLEAEAAKTANGDRRLWKIEKAGLEPSYLFGTMHMTDPRVIDLTPEARTAFDAADTVIIESTEILDPAIAAKALLSRPDLTMFTDSKTLSSFLNEAEKKTLESGLKSRGIPLVTVNKMKPWMIAGLVALPACELKRKQGGAPFLDIKLAEDAKAAGKSVEGLETIVEQLDAIASLPMEFHVKGLAEMLALGDTMDDVMETMIALYVEGRTGMIMPFLKSMSPENASDAANYGDFEERMVNARNIIMAERGEAFLAKGNAFIAVGALHLPGEKGLVELLKANGYTLTPLAK